MNTIVLGAGPVGLVSAYVLDAEICVGKRVGGGDLRRWAPTFLWRTEATERLLVDLDVPYDEQTVRFGYLGDDGPNVDFTPEERIEYYRRSRGLSAGAPIEVPRSVMSSGSRGEIATFDVSIDDLVKVLLDRVEVLDRRISLVDVIEDAGQRRVPLVRVELSGERELRTRRIVNTLPAPVFDRLLRHEGAFFRNVNRTWRAGIKTFVRASIDVCGDTLRKARDAFDFAFVYVVSGDRTRFPFDRVNFVDGDAILEFNVGDGRETDYDVPKSLGEIVLSAPRQVKGQSRDPIEFGGAVRHVGRFARWSHAIRLHDVVRELLDE